MVILSQRLSLSVRERVLLHLLPLQKYESEFELPVELTQAGISQSTRIARPNVSRAMKILQHKDLVFERLSHIKGHKRQKKIYLLTPSGVNQAKELETSLGAARIKFKNASGIIEEKSISEICSLFKSAIGKLDIIGSIDDRGLCDYRTIEGKTAGTGEMSIESLTVGKDLKELRLKDEDFYHQYSPAVEIRHFYGRSSELADFTKWMDDEDQRFIIIHGIPGIGKTTLALVFVKRYRESRNVLWYGVKDWDNLSNLVSILSSFLQNLNRNKLKHYLERSRKIEVTEVSDILAEELAGLSVLIIFDDYHRAKPEIIGLFKSLLPELRHHHGTKIILLTRELKKFYDRRDVVLDKTVVEMKLKGLDPQSSRKLLKKPQLSDNEFQKFYRISGGHPLYLELLESTADVPESPDMQEFIHEEIFSKLSESEQKLLKFASIFRYPVLAEAFFEDSSLSYSHIDTLVARSYLNRQELNFYETHDLIKTFFYNRLTKSERDKYHKLAADYYSDLLSQSGFEKSKIKKNIADEIDSAKIFEYLIEIQYHLIESKSEHEALFYTLNYGRQLIDNGRYELLLIIEDYNLEKIPSLSRGKLMALKGEIITYLGDSNLALKQLQSSLRVLGSKAEPYETAYIFTLIGENYTSTSDIRSAIKYHNMAMMKLEAIPEENRNFHEKYALARSYNNLGLAKKKNNELESALEYYNKSYDLLETEKIGTISDKAAVLENIGLLLVQLNQLDLARDYFEKSMVELEKSGDYNGLAKLFATLGEIYVELDDISTATDFFEKGVNYWERAEDLGQTFQTFMRLSQVYAEQLASRSMKSGKSSSPSYWNRLQTFFSTAEEEDYVRISRLYDRIGGLYMHRGYWHKSFEFHQKALELFEKLKDERGMAKVYNNLGVLHRSRHEPVLALEYYKKSLIYLEKLGEAKGSAITHLNIGRLYERLNKPELSKASYQKCIEIVKDNPKLDDIRGLAYLGLARQASSGTPTQNQNLDLAEKIFQDLEDKQNLEEVKMLRKKKYE